jgi:hypothetical protein
MRRTPAMEGWHVRRGRRTSLLDIARLPSALTAPLESNAVVPISLKGAFRETCGSSTRPGARWEPKDVRSPCGGSNGHVDNTVVAGGRPHRGGAGRRLDVWHGLRSHRLIPDSIDRNWFAHSCGPRDMIQGCGSALAAVDSSLCTTQTKTLAHRSAMADTADTAHVIICRPTYLLLGLARQCLSSHWRCSPGPS